MRDNSHNDFIERWAKYVLETRETKEWKRVQNRFINSQILNANKTLQRIGKLKGPEVVMRARNIQNKEIVQNFINNYKGIETYYN